MQKIIGVWKELLAVAAFLIGAAVQFAEPPPEDQQARALATFCLAALVAIAYAAVRRWNHPDYLWKWSMATASALAASLLVHYFYTVLIARNVAIYDGATYVVGQVLTPLGESYRTKNPRKTNDDLLFDAGGKTTTIWTTDGIRAARLTLRYTFLLCSPLIGGTIVASAQVAQLAARQRSTRGRRR